MVAFRDRIPSRDKIIHLYAFTTVLLHVWSFVNVFRAISAWVYMMTIWEIFGSFAYTQLSVFVESVIIVLGLLVLAILLPGKFFRDRFESQGAAMVLAIIIRLIFVHLRGDEINIWLNNRKLMRWFTDLLVVMGILSLVVSLSKWTQKIMSSVVEKFLVLGWIFLIGDMLSVLIVIGRNILS